MIKIKKYPKIMLILLVVVIGIGLLVFNRQRIENPTNVPYKDDATYINYASPTDEEKKDGDNQKQSIEEENNKLEEKFSDSGKKKAYVIITDASQYGSSIEVRAFVDNHFQDGICTIYFRKNSYTLTKEAPAYKNVSTTACTVPEINSSEFSLKGDWQVTVSYSSDNAEGVSESQTITID